MIEMKPMIMDAFLKQTFNDSDIRLNCFVISFRILGTKFKYMVQKKAFNTSLAEF